MRNANVFAENYATSVGTLSLALDSGGFFVELVEEFENAGANIFRHAFRGH